MKSIYSRGIFAIVMTLGFSCRATTAQAPDLDLIVRTIKGYVDSKNYEECIVYLKGLIFRSPDDLTRLGQKYFFTYGREAYREMKPVWNSMRCLYAWDVTLQQLIAARIVLPYYKSTKILDLRGFNIITLADLVKKFTVQCVIIDVYSSPALILSAKELGIEIAYDNESSLSAVLEQGDGSFRKKRYSLPVLAKPEEGQSDSKKPSVRGKRFSLIRSRSLSDRSS